jgi:hypothetical protein
MVLNERRAGLFVVVLCVLCGYLVSSTSTGVSAYAEGPPAARTGAPGEDPGACHGCHASYDINDPSGSVTIGGLPDTYVPGGDPVMLTVTVAQDGTNDANIAWGFELTALDANNAFACDRNQCGDTLVPTDTNTQTDSQFVDPSLRFYVKQTLDGTFYNAAGAPSASWNILWRPPDTDIGPVSFYAAGNAANGDGLPIGDYIFLNSLTISGPGGNLAARARSGFGPAPQFGFTAPASDLHATRSAAAGALQRTHLPRSRVPTPHRLSRSSRVPALLRTMLSPVSAHASARPRGSIAG